MIKPPYGEPVDEKTLSGSIDFLEELMKLLHPFMPFLTEEIWHHLAERKAGESIMISDLPVPGSVDEDIISRFDFASEVIVAVRNLRAGNNIAQKQPLSLFVKKNYNETADPTFDNVVIKLCNLEHLGYTDEKLSGALGFVVKRTEFYIPVDQTIDIEEKRQKLEEELTYMKGFLQSVQKKLSNEKFVANAKPDIVEGERKKESDAIARIRVIEEQIAGLK